MWLDLTNSELNTQHPKPPPKQRKVSTQVISLSFLSYFAVKWALNLSLFHHDNGSSPLMTH